MSTWRATRKTAIYQEPTRHAPQIDWVFLRQEFQGIEYTARWVKVTDERLPAGYVRRNAVVELAARAVGEEATARPASDHD